MKLTRPTKFAALLVMLGAFLLVACDETEIEWTDVPALLATGEVESVFQNHALDVELWMKDGSRHHVIEPGIDNIFRLVDECGLPCDDIMRATE